ncbi:oxoeicosanoid receptor 1 [Orycteropus afer afer]|uniref:Oxoeicosanoid receptor 1 n=1 Tax=Orycteropus afer afer TaxID=1230840 RepID=A0A8B7ART5_ORYAF|nr:oxoeicosanoid receptor 1 [Orycteropus afer afer]
MESQNLSLWAPLPSFPPFSSFPPSFSPSTFATVLESQVESCSLDHSPTLDAFLAPMLGVEFALGLVGNGLAFFIFCFHTQPWTSNVVFLVCLVIADLLLVINLPLRVDYYLLQEKWRFGTSVCQINLFMISTNRTASVVFLTAIALNRYLKVVQPHHVLSQASVGAAAWVAGGLWGGILLLNGHLLLPMNSSSTCLSYQLGTDSSPLQHWHEALFMLKFFLTLVLILFAVVSMWRTIRRRGLGGQAGPRRAMHVLAVVVAVYTICFLPSIIFGIMTVVAFQLHACRTFNTCSQLFHGSLAFTYLNSVLDPVLYCFSSPSFLRQTQALLGLTSCWRGSFNKKYPPSARCPQATRKAEATLKMKAWGSAAGKQWPGHSPDCGQHNVP